LFDEYIRHDALGLAQLIRAGEVSPKEVLEAAILTAERVNPRLNAIVAPLYDYARARLANDAVDGPFAYVPFLLKDVHHALAGTPMSNGSRLQKGEVSKTTAEIVRRYLDAGLVVFGKTNTPEYKLSTSTNPVVWGPTRNPWDAARTPGGSSGGSAAAVAGGIAPFASATDEGGSIRMPASCCGVFGLKPSRGRNPVGPDFRWELEGLSTSHVISRSVRDSAAALDATAGVEPGSPYAAPGPTGFLAALSEQPPTLRVAICTDGRIFGRTVEAPCIDAIRHAGTMLADLGHRVEEVALPFDEAEALRLNTIFIATSFAAFVDDLVEAYSASSVRSKLEPIDRFIWKLGGAWTAAFFERSKFRAREIGREMASFHDRYDVLVTSTLGRVPPLIEDAEPKRSDVKLANTLASAPVGPLVRVSKALELLLDAQLDGLADRLMHRTSLANLTGQPAMSVPLHWTENELPIGVQFLGPLGSERMLLQLAAQLEEAQPWAPRLPMRGS
jgi:amidase